MMDATSSKTRGDSAVLNLGEIGEEGLEFTTAGTTHTFEHQVPDSAVDVEEQEEGGAGDDDRRGLLDGETSGRSGSWWTLSCLSRSFDVDTEDVKKRLLWSVFPRPKATSDFVLNSIRPNPDLYGPFWVCVTLVFSVAISGNVASYLQSALDRSGAVSGFRWHYDFHKVTLAASAVFGYAFMVPTGLYLTFWWLGGGGSKSSASFLELLCIYGYSLAIYIPVSILWTIQISAVQWSLVMVGAGISGTVLLLALWNTIRASAKKATVILVLVIVCLHVLLACGFMLYFFHVPSSVGTKTAVSESGVSDAVSKGSHDYSAPAGQTANETKESKSQRDASLAPKGLELNEDLTSPKILPDKPASVGKEAKPGTGTAATSGGILMEANEDHMLINKDGQKSLIKEA